MEKPLKQLSKHVWSQVELDLLKHLRDSEKLTWEEIAEKFDGATANSVRKAHKRFKNNIDKKNYTKEGLKVDSKNSKVFIIGDAHFPFHSPDAYNKMMALIKKEKPTHVVQIGDLLDQYAFSKYSRSLEITPHQEIKDGLAYATTMWKTIQKMLPKTKCYQILGNHDVRMAKRISEKLPELESFVTYKELYKFKNVEVMQSDRDHIEIDGVVYVHGWLSKSIDHAKHFNKPCVHGHRHRPVVEVDRPGLWSMDVGFMADESSLPLQYTQSKITKWTMACGLVENGQPRLFFL